METLQTAGLASASKSTELLTPLPGVVKDISSPQDADSMDLQRKLAFEEVFVFVQVSF
jgi:hypothetical protein